MHLPLTHLFFLNPHLDYNYFLGSKGAVTHWRMSRTSAGHFKKQNANVPTSWDSLDILDV